ncbi:MAG: type VI secretion system lipoprotein TssJ [Thermohalobaculum sp.]|nr:type VI secretion system lipoprotein TssJ [Thermohalobaculum sp.]
MKAAFRTFAALVLAASVAACAAPPPPTTVALGITGGETMNGGAPAKVKVYYLASTAKFEAGDFFALFDAPAATLGPDLVAVDEYLLAPGKAVEDSKSFPTPPAAVGVIAAFRDIGQPGWRVSKPLAPNAANDVAVSLDGQTVTLGQ